MSTAFSARCHRIMLDRVLGESVIARTERRMVGCVLQRVLMGALMTLLLAGAAGAQQPQLVVPDKLRLTIMIKTALIAYNHGNLTGNYTVLRDLAAPSFREANTAARLAEIFQDLRKRKLDLGAVVLFQPELVREPFIDERRLLQLSGFFATRPERVEFYLAYEEVAGIWRLFAINVAMQRVVEVPTARDDEPAADRETTADSGTTAGSDALSTAQLLPLPRPRPTQHPD